MRFAFGQEAWTTIEEGEKNCYLLANGRGGYQSLSLIGAAARGDQAWLMAAKKAPNVRFHMITNLYETLWVDGIPHVLLSQRMADRVPDFEGFQFLTEFIYDGYPSWTYHVGDVTVRRAAVMAHGSNTAAVRYEIIKPEGKTVVLSVKPLLRMTPKNTVFAKEDIQDIAAWDGIQPYVKKDGEDGCLLYVSSNGRFHKREAELFGPMYFSRDERDGREASGYAAINHEVLFQAEQETSVLECIYSTEPYAYQEGCFEEFLKAHQEYEKALLKKAPLASELGKQLVLSADAYVVDRESTNGKSILAGFPFFEDWGRDTMISLPGITMLTGRFDDCKSILRTFAKYVKNGLLPNLFPEGTECPMYNSVDAPLLFINAVYEYVMLSKDKEFVKEIFPVLKGIVEAYKNGTDFHICMDSDGLILAGADLEQLTWMDVRVGDFLPTPRHGKPVEINAYWYSALCVMEQFAKELEISGMGQGDSDMGHENLASSYAELAEHVKKSFLEKFWNKEEHCLKDVLSGTAEERQIRCNQIWALTQPFTMISLAQEESILKKIREDLYTTIGLRTLSPKDAAFHKLYIGPMEQRDRAYHQGTVWAFPLGAYYRACLRYIRRQQGEQKKEWTEHVRKGIEALQEWLSEGCIGQIAEIYDGGMPTVSRGCFAQAWSVGELLRAVWEWEQF